MAKVTSRAELIDHAMRALGAPVIEINVDEDQVEDRIDDALQYFQAFHSDAIIRTYFKHKLVAADLTNGYITIPDSITSVTKLLKHGRNAGDSLFDMGYHMRLNDIYMLGGLGAQIQSYVQRMQNLELIDNQLNSTELLRFNRHMNRLHIDEGFSGLAADDYIVVEGYEIVDPQTYTEVYDDMFLKRYVTALIKRQWGANMMKFDGFTLPGGITMNGRQMFEDAVEEITKLEEEMQLAWQMPDNFLMG
jgi:hypothetical protein